MADNFDPTVGWEELDECRKRWPGKLIIKGITDPDDAREAVARGVDGIVVSNHGGRQLDGAIASIAAVSRVRDAIGGGARLLVDGGVRSGVDIVRARALGADAAMIGRPWIYALAASGEAGVRDMLTAIGKEMAVTMALAGVTTVDAISATILDKQAC